MSLPSPGSLVEIIFVLVFFARERAKFHGTRAQVQASLDQEGKATQKALDEYRKAVFPYERQQKLREHLAQKQVLDQWIGRGPLGLTPQILNRQGSRKAIKGVEALRSREKQTQMGLLKKM